MDTQRYQRVKELFHAASERPQQQRADFLHVACGSDRDLQQEVESLLAHAEAPAFDLDHAASAVLSIMGNLDAAPAAEVANHVQGIAEYRIISVLGEGGMGVVYLAEQDKPRRTVALKVIRHGLHSGAMRARFERETEVLGRLQHPGIAQIYAAGAAPLRLNNGGETDPLPFFAMEYVRGRLLIEHANAEGLGTRQRLQLLASLCDAIAYAHQQGVIHRDLKPGNILVDDRGQPKVLDFGIARLTDSDIQVTTLRTDIAQFLGTVPYMSPEQATGDAARLDRRSDIYALGVIGYELLTGRLPHDVRGKSVAEALRMISEEDPTPLSSIHRSFRGDLDTIMSKALEKEPERRYKTAGELADDIRRHLHDQPIVARPASTLYQVRKFAKRNKILVSAVAAVILVLALAVVVSLNFAITATTARNAARQAEQQQRKLRRVAEDKTIEAEHSASEARRQAYLAKIGASDSALRFNDVPAALRHLQAAEPEHRNWEWRYLSAQLDDSLAVLRHTEDARHPIYSVVFSPDDTLLYAASWDRVITVWDIASGNAVRQFTGYDSPVESLACTADGAILAVGYYDGAIRAWNTITGEVVWHVTGHQGPVWALALDSNDQRLVSGSQDNQVKVWSVVDGSPQLTLAAHQSDVTDVKFSPDGGNILSVSNDGTAKLWNAENGNVLAQFAPRAGTLWQGVFSPDGALLAITANDGAVRIWRIDERREVNVLRGHNRPARAVAFSPDGSQLVSTSQDQTVRFWEVATGRSLAVLTGHEGNIWTIDWNRKGDLIATGSLDGSVRLWDTIAAENPNMLRGHAGDVFGVTFSPDGQRLASGSKDGVRLWDVPTRELIAHLADVALFLRWSHQGDRILARSRADTLRLLDADTLLPLGEYRGGEGTLADFAFSPDDQFAAAVWRDTLFIWDLRSNELVSEIPCGAQRVSALAFSPDGNRIACAAHDGTIQCWNWRHSHQPPITATASAESLTHILWCPRGNFVAVAGGRFITLHDPQNLSLRRTFSGLNAVVRSITVNEDGSRLAAGLGTGVVMIWNSSTGEEVLSLQPHVSIIYGLAFSPDGSVLASAAAERSLMLFDTAPIGQMMQARRQAAALQPAVQNYLSDVMAAHSDRTVAAESIRADSNLSAEQRRLTLNLALRTWAMHQ